MSTLVKSAVLSLSLLAGAAVSAYAQSDNIAALPPNAAATPAPDGRGHRTVSRLCRTGSGDYLERPGAADPASSAVCRLCWPGSGNHLERPRAANPAGSAVRRIRRSEAELGASQPPSHQARDAPACCSFQKSRSGGEQMSARYGCGLTRAFMCLEPADHDPVEFLGPSTFGKCRIRHLLVARAGDSPASLRFSAAACPRRRRRRRPGSAPGPRGGGRRNRSRGSRRNTQDSRTASCRSGVGGSASAAPDASS